MTILGFSHRVAGAIRAAVTGAGLVAALLPGAGAQAQVGFAVDLNNLYSVDFGAVSSTLIGNLGINGTPESLAQAPDGTLYMADSSGNLYSINSGTGAATLIGNTGLGNIEGMDFNGNTLLATNFSATPTVFSLNLTTAAATPVITAGGSTGLVRTASVLDANTLLVRGDTPGPESLYDLNLTTGAVNLRGNIASAATFAGMDLFTDGNLYGMDIDGNYYRVNPANAATTFLGRPVPLLVLGLTFGPARGGGSAAPEPGSLALLAFTGAAGLAARRRRQPRSARGE